jgi:MFS family permease
LRDCATAGKRIVGPCLFKRWASRSRWVLSAVSMALPCVQIDYFAMNLALPRMAAESGGSATDLQWVISVYMLALGAFMVPAGRVGDMFGRRRTVLFGVALFGVASATIAVGAADLPAVGERSHQCLFRRAC